MVINRVWNIDNHSFVVIVGSTTIITHEKSVKSSIDLQMEWKRFYGK